jgi:DNA-directed RNA polymerase subunit RPC12/RpoP
MTDDTPVATHGSVSLPICPRCRTKMTIARIIPDKLDFETRTFECPTCGFENSELIKYK